MTLYYDIDGATYDLVETLGENKHLVNKHIVLYGYDQDVECTEIVEMIYHGKLYSNPPVDVIQSEVAELITKRDELESQISLLNAKRFNLDWDLKKIEEDYEKVLNSIQTKIKTDLTKIHSYEEPYIATFCYTNGFKIETLYDSLEYKDYGGRLNFSALVLNYNGKNWSLSKSQYNDGLGKVETVWISGCKESLLKNVYDWFIEHYVDDEGLINIFKQDTYSTHRLYKQIGFLMHNGFKFSDDIMSEYEKFGKKEKDKVKKEKMNEKDKLLKQIEKLDEVINSL